MATIQLPDRLDAVGSIVTASITLASLASSATVGRQSSVITLSDGSTNNRVPSIIDIELFVTLSTGTLANDKSVYLYAARSLDETNFELGPPTLGASDAAFTFSNSPVGTSPIATSFLQLGQMIFGAQSEGRRQSFKLVNPPAKLILVVLNYTGIALHATAGNHSLKIRARRSEVAGV